MLEREAVELARALIRIDSTNTGDPATIGDGEARAARFLRERLAEVGYETHYAESHPGRGNLVVRLPGADRDRGALVAHAHLDVVPVHAADWTHPPFGAEVHDGVLHGRGAVDMKGYAGILAAVARDYARRGVVPRRDLVFAFFADEEAGGVHGARWVVAERPQWLAGVTQAIGEVGGFPVPLPGDGPDRRAYLLATAEKGVAAAVLRARGPAGHASRPAADDAVGRLVRAVAAVAAHRFPVVRTPATAAFLLACAGAGDEVGADELERLLDALGPAGPIGRAGLRDLATPTVLRAGYKTNVVPGEAVAELDCRVLPGREDAFRRELAEVLHRAVGDGVRLEWRDWIPPIAAAPDAPLVERIAEAVRAEDPAGTVVPYLMPASTDNKHLSALGIDGYGFTPLRVPAGFDAFGLFHAADERVPVDALRFGARVTERILRTA
ncbi:M20/M25/M40 family metallo-hydrolase [Pseudonocardia sp. S2-4]|uniref:M20/M25/M40 family metallo-hydrolase n=1 Tax=Pseudonocardia humida TaxID=2800819 RepID=A0ABT0ZZC2_9PSEU|nr:M20/M25/M40 family metallo-hydrolase [Pseudonocardia humida]